MLIVKKELYIYYELQKNNEIIKKEVTPKQEDQDQDALQFELLSRLYNREEFQEIAGDLFKKEDGDGFRFKDIKKTNPRAYCEIITDYIIKEDAESGAWLNW